MKNLWHKFLDFILPPRCIYCGKTVVGENGLCQECFGKIRFIAKPYCKICGTPFESSINLKDAVCGRCLKEKRRYFAMQRSAFIYNEDSKNMLLALKFQDKTSNAPVIARLMFRAGKDIFDEKPDFLIPVPLHYARLIARKYNQSALLAAELSKLSGVSVDNFSLKRVRNTTPQVNFSGKERIKNVKNAFSVKKSVELSGKKVVLIDDVMTTGSTLKECAIALKKAGVKEIYALTAARTSNK